MKYSTILTVVLCFFYYYDATAQQYSGGNDKELEKYSSERTVLVRIGCSVPTIEFLDHDTDPGLLTVNRLDAWSSGGIVNSDGTIVTTYHTLKSVIDKQFRSEDDIGSYWINCDPDKVEIGFYTIDMIKLAERNAEPKFLENIFSRDEAGNSFDILILQAETGGNQLPYFCTPGLPVSRRGIIDQSINVGGIKRTKLSEFNYDFDSSANAKTHIRGGRLSRFLEMRGASAEPGMSGGPVVNNDGEFVGAIYGYSDDVNPTAIDNYLIPLYLFDDVLSKFVQSCDKSICEDCIIEEFNALGVIVEEIQFSIGYRTSRILPALAQYKLQPNVGNWKYVQQLVSMELERIENGIDEIIRFQARYDIESGKRRLDQLLLRVSSKKVQAEQDVFDIERKEYLAKTRKIWNGKLRNYRDIMRDPGPKPEQLNEYVSSVERGLSGLEDSLEDILDSVERELKDSGLL